VYRLLEGYRGAPGADIDAVEEVLLRLSALVDARPQIAELDMNPVIAGPEVRSSSTRASASPRSRPRGPLPSLWARTPEGFDRGTASA
jgi:acetate---CoA ligase (ADP-forming)